MEPDPLVQRLVDRRHDLGLTQGRTAERLRVSQATLSRWESGDRHPPLSGLRRWAEVLGFSLHLEMAPELAEVGHVAA